ncbi:MAG: hypothetical protein KGI45_02130 [Patescibacteria group bacterium]|nr:hypothetical protein [Patescibacteria group bacterium]
MTIEADEICLWAIASATSPSNVLSGFNTDELPTEAGLLIGDAGCFVGNMSAMSCWRSPDGGLSGSPALANRMVLVGLAGIDAAGGWAAGLSASFKMLESSSSLGTSFSTRLSGTGTGLGRGAGSGAGIGAAGFSGGIGAAGFSGGISAGSGGFGDMGMIGAGAGMGALAIAGFGIGAGSAIGTGCGIGAGRGIDAWICADAVSGSGSGARSAASLSGAMSKSGVISNTF